MGIRTGRDEGIRLLTMFDLAFIGTLTDYAKGLFLLGIYSYQLIYFVYRYVNKIITTNSSLYT
jgi:hypothetical protein